MHMHKGVRIVLILIGVTLVVSLIGFAYVLLSRDTEETPVEMSGDVFPLAPSDTDGPRDNSVFVGARDGGTIVTRDFINNGTTIEDPANDDSYYLAGTTGYCYDDGTCASAGSGADGYNVVYYAGDRSFIIGLTREPLGEVRRNAERYLTETLGLTQVEMCALTYYVGTTAYVSSMYGSMGNLGFSFCPGAVPLP